MGKLDESKHEPQIAGDRRLARRDRHELGVETMTGFPEPPAVLSDRGLLSGWIGDRICDDREHHRRPAEFVMDPVLDPSQLPRERLSHGRVLAHWPLAHRDECGATLKPSGDVAAPIFLGSGNGPCRQLRARGLPSNDGREHPAERPLVPTIFPDGRGAGCEGDGSL
jgi:hypothetical protein